MKGYVSTAVAFEDLDASLRQNLPRSKDVRSPRIAAKGYDGCVLEQKHRVAESGLLAERNQLLLQAKAGNVIDGAELEN